MLRPIMVSALSPVMSGVMQARRIGGAIPIVKPVIDYLVMVGSSSTARTYTTNPILGDQRQSARAAFCAEGLDVPVISAGVGGSTVADVKAGIAGIISGLGPIPTGKKVGFVVHIGSNDINTSYLSATQVKRDQVRDDLIAILATIRNAGHEPILTTSTTRNGDQATFDSWMNGLYHPLAVQETPAWTSGGKCVFDYTQLYKDNLATPNWFDPDNTHPWMATPAIQTYTAQILNQYATVPAISARERFLFFADTMTIGGVNVAPINNTKSIVVNSRGNVVTGVSLVTGATDAGSLGLSTSARGNAGVYDVSLLNDRAQSANLYIGTPWQAHQRWTANFGAAYANRTGILRLTLNSTFTPRSTLITLPNATSVIVQGETGIEFKEIAFTLNGSGSVLLDMWRSVNGTTAISGVEFDFAP